MADGAFRIPHSALRTEKIPHPTLRIPNSALRTPHWAGRRLGLAR
jgi:hypothetical protein